MSVKRVWAVLLAVVIGVPVFSPALGAEGTTFVDIGPGDWFAPYVEVCVESGMMSGTGKGRFSPGRVLTTAELLAVSARLDQYLTTGSGVLEQAPEDFCPGTGGAGAAARVVFGCGLAYDGQPGLGGG